MSFFEIAQQYIQDTELRRRGGYRGIVRRKEMKPEISAAVFAAKAPQVLKPIVGAKGVYLIWVEEVIKPPLDNTLRHQIGSDLFSEWIKQKIDELEVFFQL
jgi:parvulin-like peptidyl-prolyl isomerase